MYYGLQYTDGSENILLRLIWNDMFYYQSKQLKSFLFFKSSTFALEIGRENDDCSVPIQPLLPKELRTFCMNYICLNFILYFIRSTHTFPLVD